MTANCDASAFSGNAMSLGADLQVEAQQVPKLLLSPAIHVPDAFVACCTTAASIADRGGPKSL